MIGFRGRIWEQELKKPLPGLPQKPIDLGNGKSYTPGPNPKIRKVAQDYMKSINQEYTPPQSFQKVDPIRAKHIADEYDKMKHDPNHPDVKASYKALADETMAQWQHVKKAGLKVSWMKKDQPDPYAKNLHLSHVDVKENNHLHVYPTENGYGSDSGLENYSKDHPMLQKTGEVVNGHHMVVNDAFRIVHDYFGHHKEGFGFGPSGEDNAWRHHASMFSPKARGAMTAETRGQNSFVNYGKFKDHNKTAKASETHYADQKAGLLPSWVQNTD